jgi:hypothetical protein
MAQPFLRAIEPNVNLDMRRPVVGTLGFAPVLRLNDE